MKSFSTIALLSLSGLASLPRVLAHGDLASITVAGKLFMGPKPNDNNTPSVIRTINSIEPVQNVNSDDMSCGAGAANKVAKLTADVKAGDEIKFDWVNGNGDHPWPHKFGPMITYLADCGGDCSEFKSLDAKWFKIEEAGINEKTGKWIQEETTFVGQPYSMKFPEGIPDGNYLMRHEIIALHNAQSTGGAEFYPSCAQIKVSGGGSESAAKKLPASDFASFPGAYSATDPGIRVNVFNPEFKQSPYQFPGPNVAAFSGSGSGSGSGNGGNGGEGNDDNDNDDGSKPSATATATTSASTSTITPAPVDNGNTEEGNDDEFVETVTVTVTVTSQPKKATKTVTVTDVVEAAAVTAPVTATPAATTDLNASGHEGPYRRRSRIMGRRHI